MKVAEFNMDGIFPFSLSSIISDRGEPTIYIGSPFSGYPTTKSNVASKMHTLLVDSNIFGDISEGRYQTSIKQLIGTCSGRNMDLSILYAAIETHQNYHAPDILMNKFFLSLLSNYGIPYSEEKKNILKKLITEYKDGTYNDRELIKDYLVVVKQIFLNRTGLRKHVEALTKVVRDKGLPQYGFIMVLSLVLFYARKNQSDYDTKMINKINSDMQIKSTKKEEEALLRNVAGDICLFLSCSTLLYHFSDQINQICWLASRDATIGLMLNEICFTKATYREVCEIKHTTVSMLEIDIRKDSKSYQTLHPILTQYWNENLTPPNINKNDLQRRRQNLKSYAQEIMNQLYPCEIGVE